MDTMAYIKDNELAVEVTPELVTIFKANPIHPDRIEQMTFTHEDFQAVIANVDKLKGTK